MRFVVDTQSPGTFLFLPNMSLIKLDTSLQIFQVVVDDVEEQLPLCPTVQLSTYISGCHLKKMSVSFENVADPLCKHWSDTITGWFRYKQQQIYCCFLPENELKMFMQLYLLYQWSEGEIDEYPIYLITN